MNTNTASAAVVTSENTVTFSLMRDIAHGLWVKGIDPRAFDVVEGEWLAGQASDSDFVAIADRVLCSTRRARAYRMIDCAE